MNTRFTLSVAVLGLAFSTARAQVLYFNDFESSTAFGFTAPHQNFIRLPTDGSPMEAPVETSVFFQPSPQNQLLTVDGLQPSTSYTIGFDLFIGRSWDGNSTAVFGGETLGPDTFSLSVETGFVSNVPFPNTFHVQGFGSLISATFTNSRESDGINNDYTQSYSDSDPLGGGSGSYLSGADVSHDDDNLFLRYGIYRFSNGTGNPTLTFTTGPSSTVAQFQFFAEGQGIEDEFWAIDNVQVSLTAVPEPATYGWAGGLLVMAAGVTLRIGRRNRD